MSVSTVEIDGMNLTPEEIERIINLYDKMKATKSLSYTKALKSRIDKIKARGRRRYFEEQLIN